MVLTLQEVLVRALKKLEHSSFRRFIEKLSVWEVRKEYKNIPKDELTGKDPEHVAGLINRYYRYAYGAEVTLSLLEDIGEKKVREELQQDLREDSDGVTCDFPGFMFTVDISGHGLGTTMFTDRVNFIDNHRSDLIRRISDVDPVLHALWSQGLLTEEQYNDVMEERTSEEKMEVLCDIISHWEDTGKYMAYTLLKQHDGKIIKDLEAETEIRKKPLFYAWDRVNFIASHRSDLIRKITDVDPVLCDLRDQGLLTEDQYNDMMKKRTSEEKMEVLCNIISHWEDTGKYTAYRRLRKYSKEFIKNLEADEMKRISWSYYWGCGNFIDIHQSALIKRISDLDPVLHDLQNQGLLTQEQYNDVLGKRTSEEKMTDLCDIFKYWEDTGKYAAFKVLKKHKRALIKDLEAEEKMKRMNMLNIRLDKDHFVNRHRYDLIYNIKKVNPVLDDLRSNHLLTGEQYEELQAMTKPEEKMRSLCDILCHQSDTKKDQFYNSLWRYNYTVISDLEKTDETLKSTKSSFDHMSRAGDHFIDKHKEDLIERVQNVLPVICDLYDEGLLNPQEEIHITYISDPKIMMRRLYDIIRHWDDDDKEELIQILYKHNPTVIEHLTMLEGFSKLKEPVGKDHFVNRHRYDLIYNIKKVNPVLDDLRSNHLLTGEQYEELQAMTKPEEKMRSLCDILCHQSDTKKDQFYNSLWRYNYTVISDLEKTDETLKSTKSSFDHMSRAGDHFIDQHKEDLIERVQNVLPVICDLYDEGLLNPQEEIHITYISDPKIMMRRLYDIIRHWDDDDKEELIQILYKHNPTVIEDLTMLEGFSKLKEPETSEKNVKPLTSCVKMTGDGISCKHCGEQTQDSDYSVSPIGSIYRLELNSPGLYRCQKTGIKFLVKGPVIIQYKLDSWSDHLKHIPGNVYEILGPLFNIQTRGEPNAVSAVYLPHYLCLKVFNEDPSLIKCAHFRDGNMTLESPAQIAPYYITVENPTFSCLGPLLSLRKKKIPIHGSVFIYFRILCKGDPHEEYKIHLYVLPYSTNAEETLDIKNKKCGFQRITKPEHTGPVYTKIRYLITGHPGVLAHPKTLKFDSERYQFTELRLKEKDVDTYLSVSEEISEDTVWDTHLTQGDIKDVAQLLSSLTIHEAPDGDFGEPSVNVQRQQSFPPTPKVSFIPNSVAGVCPLPDHFVDRHRQALIQRTSHISPVLDNLLSQRLLTQEQYDTLRGIRPHQEVMRQLYVYMTIWGHHDKEKFYQALKTCNEPLIRDLENKDIVQL